MAAWYRTGTIAVANGGTTVTGTGTGWINQVVAGDRITFDGGGKWYEIASTPSSNTALTLATNFTETTVSGGAYAIDRSSAGWNLASKLAVQAAEVLDRYPFPGGSGDAGKSIRANSGGTAYELYTPAATPATRAVLTGNVIYYVRQDGNDANTGTANTSGGAFRQIQKAIDTVATLDLSIYNATISVGDGSYAAFVCLPLTGAGACHIVGNTGTPANVSISSASVNACVATGTWRYDITGLKFSSSAAGCIFIDGGDLIVRNIEFGATASGFPHQYVATNGSIRCYGSTAISGGAQAHVYAGDGGRFTRSSQAVTLTGTPAFSLAFAYVARGASAFMPFNSYTGSATGYRFQVGAGGSIETFSSGATGTLPGSIDGLTLPGGTYN